MDNIEINRFLGAPIKQSAKEWLLDKKIHYLRDAGFQILRAEEETLNCQFDDIGVVVFYLKIISWQIPGFSVEKYRDRLLALHNRIEKLGPFISKSHRYLVVAQKK